MLILSGNDIKNLRNFLNLNQEEFSMKFQLTDRTTVGKLEKSKIIPADTIEKIQNEMNMTDNDLEHLLNELDTNNSQINESSGMEKHINEFLHEEWKSSNNKKDEEIKRLFDEKNRLQQELSQTQNNFIDLSRRIDLLGHEFEIYKLQMEQKVQNILSDAQKYTDEVVTELDADIVNNVKEEVEKILAEHLQDVETKGLSGTGEYILNNLLQNAPNILEAIMRLKNGQMSSNGVNDNFGQKMPFNKDYMNPFSKYPNTPFNPQGASGQNSSRSNAENMQNNNINKPKGEQNETK